MPLAIDLKQGTKQSHSAAENTKFVSSFLRGVVSEENYRPVSYTHLTLPTNREV